MTPHDDPAGPESTNGSAAASGSATAAGRAAAAGSRDEESPTIPASSDGAVNDLREILVGEDRRRVAALQARVLELEQQLSDPDTLISLVSPVMGEAIAQKIRTSRAEMVEALYPIIGQLVARSVSEAIRDLARSIDARMRTSFAPGVILRRLRARISGVSSAEAVLRESLPFSVTRAFLIHRETGLLLQHLSSQPGADADSDLISGMLTAIRDFVQDAFGRGQEGQLDEIEYGDRRILIEASQRIYLAVEVEGVEPAGFREVMRQQLIELEHSFASALRTFDGDLTRFAGAQVPLRALMTPTASSDLSPSQNRMLVAIAGLAVACVLAGCLGGLWLLRGALRAPASPQTTILVVVTATPAPATATPIPAPTATTAPSLTPTSPPTPAPTQTPPPTSSPTQAPLATVAPTPTTRARAVVVAARLNVRSGPSMDFPVFALADAGQEFDVVGRNSTAAWWRICCVLGGQAGWVSADWVTVAGGNGAAGSLETLPVLP